MGNTKAVYNLVKELSLKHSLYKITLESIKNFAKTRINGGPESVNESDIANLESILKELERNNKLKIEYIDKMAHRVVFLPYFIERVKAVYEEMKTDLHLPFPTPELFKQDIPPNQIEPVDVKSEFVSFLENDSPVDNKILRLMLPQFEYSLLVMPSMLKKDLLHRAIEKIKAFLSKESNRDYIRSRVVAAMKKDQPTVRRMFDTIENKTPDAINSIYEPSPFSFSFWSHLASSVIKEYQSKKSAYVGDYVFAQAAYLIGFYNVYYKGKSQKSSDKDSALHLLNVKIKKDPYCFSLRDIYAFRDDNGIELIKVCGRNEYNNYITKMITELDSKGIPELIMVKTEAGKEYFISRDLFAQYLLKEIAEASLLFKNEIVFEWKDSLENYIKLEEMKSITVFNKMVKKKLKKQRPVLSSMLDYNMLSKLLTHDKVREAERMEISRMLNENMGRIASYDTIFNLDRAAIFSEVKLLVPLYKSSSIISVMVTMFAKIFGVFHVIGKKDKSKKKQKNKDLMEFTKTSTDDFVVAVANLKDDFIGVDGNIELSMEELINKWNPLIGSISKANLVEDVNSFVRDYIRKIKKSFLVSAPDKERVESMAMRLSENSAFSMIKNRDILQRYIELYMIQLLGTMRLMK